MKKLVFEKSESELFSILYEAAVTSETGISGNAELRALDKALDRLEEVSEEVNGIPQKREPTPEAWPLQIELEDSQFDQIFRLIKAVRWAPIARKKAIALIDKLESASAQS